MNRSVFRVSVPGLEGQFGQSIERKSSRFGIMFLIAGLKF